MRYALAVLETQNFRAAATRTNVSQSGLSMQLHKLEELLDTVALYVRINPCMEEWAPAPNLSP